jgi:hypothetical protein
VKGGDNLARKVEKRKYSDRREYLIRVVSEKRKKIRRMAVEYKGSKCEICGYDRCIEALEFHHNDITKKDFGISNKGYTRSWLKVKEELEKCTMVCANCHRELHAKLAASSGNIGMKKQANSGKPPFLLSQESIGGNPELFRHYIGRVQRLYTCYPNYDVTSERVKR